MNQHDPLSISYAVMPGGMLYKHNAIYVIYERLLAFALLSLVSRHYGFQVLCKHDNRHVSVIRGTKAKEQENSFIFCASH